MTDIPNEVSDLRARINRLRWTWQRRIGWMGGLALLLLASAAVLAWTVRPMMASARAELARSQQALANAAPRAIDNTAETGHARDTLRAELPPLAKRGASMARLLVLLERSPLSIGGGDYVAEDQAPGLVRVRATIPIQGSYAATRKLVAAILNAMPHAALDALELERDAESGDALTGRLRLSLFFRQEGA